MFTTDLLNSATGSTMNYDRIRTADLWKLYLRDAGIIISLSFLSSDDLSLFVGSKDKEDMGLWMNNMDNLLVFVRFQFSETAGFN